MHPCRPGPAWVCRGHACRLPFFKRRGGAADRLRRHLGGPREGSLADICSAPERLQALAESAGGGEDGVSGIWKKDKARCDPMDEAFEAVKLPWFYRKAVGILSYLEIEDTEEHFRTCLKAGGVMDVVEQYPWSGEVVTHKRRDKRQGHHTGRVVRTEQGPQIQVKWGEPYGGEGEDTFTVAEGVLTQTSVMRLASGASCTYRTVYRRVRSRDG